MLVKKQETRVLPIMVDLTEQEFLETAEQMAQLHREKASILKVKKETLETLGKKLKEVEQRITDTSLILVTRKQQVRADCKLVVDTSRRRRAWIAENGTIAMEEPAQREDFQQSLDSQLKNQGSTEEKPPNATPPASEPHTEPAEESREEPNIKPCQNVNCEQHDPESPVGCVTDSELIVQDCEDYFA